MSTRLTAFDHARVDVTMDPEWLLAPLFARDFTGIPVAGPNLPARLLDPPAVGAVPPPSLQAAADWPAWWAAALAYRPGTPPPRQADLVAFSPTLGQLWATVEPDFDRWLSARTPAPRDTVRENEILGALSDPRPLAIRVLVVPVSGELVLRPDSDRLVVSPAGRGSAAYRAALSSIFR